MALAKSQRSLKAWGKQKWRTKSGKKSSETGERYLPEKAIKSLTASEYARTTREKRKAKKKGTHQPKQPKSIAAKVRRFRQFSQKGDIMAKSLTERQKNTLKNHSKHHTAKHMAMMRKEMRAGKSFTAAHKKAQKKVGT